MQPLDSAQEEQDIEPALAEMIPGQALGPVRVGRFPHLEQKQKCGASRGTERCVAASGVKQTSIARTPP
jgi:hypothetical protein